MMTAAIKNKSRNQDEDVANKPVYQTKTGIDTVLALIKKKTGRIPGHAASDEPVL